MNIKFPIFILLISFFVSAKAQKVVDEQSAGWYMYFGNHKLSNKFGLHTEYQWRRYPLYENWQQSLLRIGLDYYTKSGPMLTAGYAWIHSWPWGKQPTPYASDEHRIWEQLILQHQNGRLYFHHRYRLEQRFIEQKVLDNQGEFVFDEFVFRQRARYRIFINIPLSNKERVDNTLFFAFYDEVFVNFGGGIGNNILDQNRLYLALGWWFNNNVNVQSGYLNHFVIKSDAQHMEQNHTFQLLLQYNLDFSKSE